MVTFFRAILIHRRAAETAEVIMINERFNFSADSAYYAVRFLYVIVFIFCTKAESESVG